MKALQILIYIRRNKFIMDLLDEDSINEAIAELESLKFNRREWYQKGYRDGSKEALQQPKSCEGCKHLNFGNHIAGWYDKTYKCDKNVISNTKINDFCCNLFEPKEQ